MFRIKNTCYGNGGVFVGDRFQGLEITGSTKPTPFMPGGFSAVSKRCRHFSTLKYPYFLEKNKPNKKTSQ